MIQAHSTKVGKKNPALRAGFRFFDKSYNFYQNLQVFTFKANLVPISY